MEIMVCRLFVPAVSEIVSSILDKMKITCIICCTVIFTKGLVLLTNSNYFNLTDVYVLIFLIVFKKLEHFILTSTSRWGLAFLVHILQLTTQLVVTLFHSFRQNDVSHSPNE